MRVIRWLAEERWVVYSHLFSESKRIIIQKGRRANGYGGEIEKVEKVGRDG